MFNLYSIVQCCTRLMLDSRAAFKVHQCKTVSEQKGYQQRDIFKNEFICLRTNVIAHMHVRPHTCRLKAHDPPTGAAMLPMLVDSNKTTSNGQQYLFGHCYVNVLAVVFGLL